MRTLIRHSTLTLLIIALNVIYNPYWLECFICYLMFNFFIALLRFSTLKRELQRVEKNGRNGHLYAFYDHGSLVPAIKIGRETHRGDRLSNHRTAAPLNILIVFSFEVKDAIYAETFLHRRYQHLRLSRRNEWFMLSVKLICESLLLRKLK